MSAKRDSTVKYEIKQIIAQREITYKRKDKELKFIVYIGAPLPRTMVEEEVQDWYCPIRIPGLYSDVHVAFGIDSVQALHHALVLAGNLLEDSIPGRFGLLSWHDSSYLGFPPPVHVPTKSEAKKSMKPKASHASKHKKSSKVPK